VTDGPETAKGDSASAPAPQAGAPAGRRPNWIARLVPWLITLACFYYLYGRLSAAAARDGATLTAYLTAIFAGVSWTKWLALMIPYSAFFFLIDSLVAWRVINWFNAKVPYRDILPIRGSSYILSIVNEQVGKGAMALYLNRRHGIPGWEVGSSMLFIMFCEFYYLLTWALIGWALQSGELPEVFDAIPVIAGVAYLAFPVLLAVFHGKLLPSSGLSARPIMKAFRDSSAWQYATIIGLRSPALMAAVFVYTNALQLFGIEGVSFGRMLGVLPVIFFGAATPGPMRTVAITLWVVLFPGYEGQMTAFGFVQHNFFIFFNAAIGLLFLRRANRELFEGREVRPAV
jgi:hypothetical protein